MTTPNAEYNVRFETLPAGKLRHRDHRFEWTRAEFAAWADGVAERHGYSVRSVGDRRPTTPSGRPADADGGVHADDDDHDPRAVARRADRRVGLGQVDVRGASHFLPTEVLSSDFCRGLVADDENDQAATNDAFEVLHFIAAQAARPGRLTVVDATNVQPGGAQAAGRAGPRVPRACRSRSCSTCPSGSARSATARARTATSARTCCATSAASSAGR